MIPGLEVPCPGCGRPSDRAFPHCPWCGLDKRIPRGDLEEALERGLGGAETRVAIGRIDAMRERLEALEEDLSCLPRKGSGS